MMYKSCIFDLDGTLVDTLDSLVFSVNTTLELMHLPNITREQCRQFVGNGSRILLKKALQAAGSELDSRIEEAVRIYEDVFEKHCLHNVTPYEGIPELLEALQRKGIELAVLSNKPHKQTVRVVTTIFGEQTFSWIQGQQDDIPKKPDPSAAIWIANQIKSTPQETIYIGDSEVDIETGIRACMRTIGVSWGFREKEFLRQIGAKYIADTPYDILHQLEQLELEDSGGKCDESI